jgi:YtkA-like
MVGPNRGNRRQRAERVPARRSWFWGLSLLAAACGEAGVPAAPPPDFSGPALGTFESDSGRYSLEVRTSPQPARKGVNWAEYRITSDAGAPVTGLSLDVQPWMPAHGHGTTLRPTVSESAGGVYTIGNLLFFMSGHWELRTRFGTDFNDVAVPSLDVN